MIGRLLTILAAAASLGAAKAPPPVEYRLGVEPATPGATPELAVEMRLRGDADGETRIALPTRFGDGKDFWRYVSGFAVEGAAVSEDGAAVRVLRHRPGARLTIRYRVSTAYPDEAPGAEGNPYRGPLIRPTWFAVLGNTIFATPDERRQDPASFAWARLPAGWRAVSDLEHGAAGRPMVVADVVNSVTMGGANLAVAARAIPGGQLRVAALSNGPLSPEALADSLAPIVAAQRAFWDDVREPYLVAVIPLAASSKGDAINGTARGDAFALYATPNAPPEELKAIIAHEHMHSWIPNRTATALAGARQPEHYWFSEGFTDFYRDRTLVRGGLGTAADGVKAMNATLTAYDASAVRTAPNGRIVAGFWTEPALQKLPYQRGALLALKWDEEIRRKTGGRKDLDDVVLKMRDRYVTWPAGTGPDAVTGLVSAAWEVAELDLRPDIARYADGGAAVDLPDALFDGCVLVRTTVAPAFDAGFDITGSLAAKVVRGVRRGGSAWNSGLRDGMIIEAGSYQAGDTSHQVTLSVRNPPARGKAARGPAVRKIAYWPYGDDVTSRRRLELKPGLAGEALAACTRKLGGL